MSANAEATKWIFLLTGGIAGTAARYVVARTIFHTFGSRFPFGTLGVNLTGCLALGFFAILSEENTFFSPDTRLLLLVGFCGAYTTFSTWILETDLLIKQGQIGLVLVNVIGSVAAGFLLFRTGVALGRLFL